MTPKMRTLSKFAYSIIIKPFRLSVTSVYQSWYTRDTRVTRDNIQSTLLFVACRESSPLSKIVLANIRESPWISRVHVPSSEIHLLESAASLCRTNNAANRNTNLRQANRKASCDHVRQTAQCGCSSSRACLHGAPLDEDRYLEHGPRRLGVIVSQRLNKWRRLRKARCEGAAMFHPRDGQTQGEGPPLSFELAARNMSDGANI